MNLSQSKADPCLFYRKGKNGSTEGVVVVYVDDCILTGCKEFIEEMKQKLKKEFGVVEDGKLRKLLGIRYEWVNEGNDQEAKVILNMEDKAREIVNAYEATMEEGTKLKTYNSPGTPGTVLSKHTGEPVRHDQYRSILGRIMFYVTKIGPECSYACGQLARHMHNPGEEHWRAMERFVGYLKGKEKHELVIRRPMEVRVISMGDTSYGDCPDTRRSSTADIHTVGGALTNWRAQKTNTVCLSPAEAEYIELTAMSKEQRFMEMLLQEIFYCLLPGVMYEDNKAAMYLVKNKHVSTRTKHIDIKHHYVREHVGNNYGVIVKIKSEDNFPDILTKNTSISIFQRLGTALLNGFKGFEKLFDFSNNHRENY